MPEAATNTVAQTATGSFGCEFTQQLSEGQELWNRIVGWLAENGVAFAIRILFAAVILVAGALAIKLLVAAVGRAVEKSGRGNTLFATFAKNVTSKICWIILLVTVLGKLGVNIGPIIAGLGVTGFILGFAFQESLGNLASGMMIAINEPFKVGEFVSAGGLEGVVLEVNMMATVLSTPDCKRITIPNKSVWGGPITNYTVLGRRRVDLQIGIAYGADIARALEVIREAVVSVPGVLTDPEPAVAVAGLDASAVTINVRPWSRSGDYWGVYSGTLQAVKDALRRAEIEIPYPQIVVHNAK